MIKTMQSSNKYIRIETPEDQKNTTFLDETACDLPNDLTVPECAPTLISARFLS